MVRRIFSFVFVAILLPASVPAHTAALINGGENTAIVENSDDNVYKAVRLTPEIYNNANGDLSDILIKDENGETLPYFINSCNLTEYKTDRREYPMELVNAYTKDNSFYFDYKVSDIPSGDVEATSVNMATRNVGFAKNIELYGSYDNTNWEFVQNDTIYSVDGNSKLSAEFTKTQKYTHYRFKLGNNLEKITFDEVTLVYRYTMQEWNYFIEGISPTFSTEEHDKMTDVCIAGLKNLRLYEIIVNTDSMFRRTVYSHYGGSKEIYNLLFDETSYIDTTVPFGGQRSWDDVLVLQIDNGDDKPIKINGITVRYFADELVFAGGGSREYTIHFGADDAKTAPVYDIERYRREILAGGIDRLAIKSVVFGEAVEAAEPFDYRMIFNVAVVVVAVILGMLLLLKLKPMTRRDEREEDR